MTFRRNQNDAGTTSDYDITVNDNAYPWKGSSEATYRNEGYVDLASPVFRSGEFKSLKAKEKYRPLNLGREALRREKATSMASGHFMKHGIKRLG